MFLNPGSEGGGGREWRRPWRSNGEGRVWGGRGSVFIWGRKGSQRERRWLWPFIPALHSRLPGQQSSLILSAVGVHICSCLLRDMSRLCSISILIFLAVFITWRHELSTLWLCSPPPCTLKSLNCPPPLQIYLRWGPGGSPGPENLEEIHHAGLEGRCQPQVKALDCIL